MALWRGWSGALGRRLSRQLGHVRSMSAEAEVADMQSPLFNTPDMASNDNPASFGSSIRDQTNVYVKEVNFTLFKEVLL